MVTFKAAAGENCPRPCECVPTLDPEFVKDELFDERTLILEVRGEYWNLPRIGTELID